jgi:LAO/AO transport system kinase
VFVETVGIGQSESEVALLVDTLLFVAQPGAGDLLQFMKAGIIELPDVFAVNKCDLGPAAERTANELTAGLGLGEATADDWIPPVLRVSARDGTGIPGLVAALGSHRRHLLAGEALAARRRRARVTHVEQALRERYGSFGVETLGGPAVIAERVDAARSRSAFALVLELSREIEEALRKP